MSTHNTGYQELAKDHGINGDLHQGTPSGKERTAKLCAWKELFPPDVTADLGLGQPNTKYTNHDIK